MGWLVFHLCLTSSSFSFTLSEVGGGPKGKIGWTAAKGFLVFGGSGNCEKCKILCEGLELQMYTHIYRTRTYT